MNDSGLNTSTGWGATARQIAGELAEAIQLRRELAELEIRHDRALLKRFSLVGGVSAAMVLCGVPLLLTAAAWELAQVTELGFAGWLVCFGAVLVVPGTVGLAAGDSQAAWRVLRTAEHAGGTPGRFALGARMGAPGPGRLGKSAHLR